MKLTPEQLAKKFNELAEECAKEWVRGNNSGSPARMKTSDRICESLQGKMQGLAPKGAVLYFPGLYPIMTIKGMQYSFPFQSKLWNQSTV